ncbi:HK97 gp10 family phage protein [Pedobacter sp. MC2016-24]|uniref:HK97 gp10 family phage protein n=1 Tax=Pedobacter sp. MC2016-24 TaxID=2780090 RepID=UPI00187FAD19|nr:HK97 gp10 family phage protein [Pedobacter sp. MC2016-24]MBE9598743.1 HK97 gp10 family phage protein [Pedobacter sp. MC2016-24]
MRTRNDFNVRVNGLDESLARLSRLTTQNEDKVKTAIAETAINVERKAKENLAATPFKDSSGGIAQSGYILYRGDRMGAEVGFNMHYAPYIEYGTGSNVDVPPGFEDYAWQFKGDDKRQVNIKPMPYFHPAINSELDNLKRKLNDSLSI